MVCGKTEIRQGRVVRDADAADLSRRLRVDEDLPSGAACGLVGLGAVDEHETQVIKAEVLQRVVHGCEGVIVAILVVPEL